MWFFAKDFKTSSATLSSGPSYSIKVYDQANEQTFTMKLRIIEVLQHLSGDCKSCIARLSNSSETGGCNERVAKDQEMLATSCITNSGINAMDLSESAATRGISSKTKQAKAQKLLDKFCESN